MACLVAAAVLAGCGWQGARENLPDRVEFRQHIRPIFTAKCTSCHGGVKKAGGVSFIYQSDVQGAGESGKRIVVAGDPGSSELIRRISSSEANYRMPPADHGGPLSSREVALLKRWIEQGARWEEHWAYVRPQPQPVPKVHAPAWVKNEIDAFVLARLEKAGLQPEPEQDKARLFRRVTLDLTGLPPSTEELDSYLADTRPDAYDRAVDRLLASPHFGERWATPWLDLARYADTQGFERDNERQIWAYRNWVIRALNADLPFDQFTIKQTAGDLLPDPQPDDLIATAFHRNSMTNAEGGTDDEEFRIVAAIDRVNTTWQAWMGTTFACTQCHSHPYDPFPNESYYRFLDFFNNTADHDTSDDFPTLAVATNPDDEEKLFRLQRELARAEDDYAGPLRKLTAETAWAPLDYSAAGSSEGVVLSVLRDREGIQYLQTGPDTPRGTVHTVRGRSKASQLTALRIDALMPPDRSVATPADPFIVSFIEVAVVTASGAETPVKLTHAVADEPQSRTAPEQSLDRNPQGWGAYPKQHYPHWVVFVPKTPVRLPEGASLRVTLHHTAGHDGAQQPVLRRFRLSVSDRPAWTETLGAPAVVDALARRTQAQIAIGAMTTTRVPVMRDLPQGYRRVTNVFSRGNWLNKGKQVTAGVPALLHPLPQTDRPDRMALARWLVAPENPLTARVAVNRFWEQLFGLGIVETLEDFGSAGMAPTHPELLDHLALRFQNELGWSVKRLLRELVSSATYRQASTVSRDKLEKDPRNQLLSRGPRQRLTAEMMRDNALAVSGLLSRKQFGPPVMPPQPAGIWRSAYNSGRWETSKGEDRYRRSIYTFLKRATPYPSLMTFDAPSRDVCIARRIPTNTPLQALVTLNDPVYVESAQQLARWARGESADTPETWIRRALRRALLREPSAADVNAMLSLYRDSLQHYATHPALVTGLSPSASEAALTVVASAIMNLDEFLTR
ncbi:MAG: PSD1 and planctomycete cytochrome C domain-containing protein [Vicinamibacterales bacterium]